MTTKRGDRQLQSTTRSLPIALMRAREKVMGPIREMLADTGVTEQQWRILRVLEEFGPMDATQLADRASLLLPSQTRILQTLSEKGYVTRAQDAADRRRQQVAITSDGAAIIASKAAQALEIAADMERRLGAEKYQALLDLLADVDAI